MSFLNITYSITNKLLFLLSNHIWREEREEKRFFLYLIAALEHKTYEDIHCFHIKPVALFSFQTTAVFVILQLYTLNIEWREKKRAIYFNEWKKEEKRRRRRTTTTKCKHGNYEVVLWTEKLLLFSCCFEFPLPLFWYMLRAYILFKCASECVFKSVTASISATVELKRSYI